MEHKLHMNNKVSDAGSGEPSDNLNQLSDQTNTAVSFYDSS
jgi:hypothetical protein